MTEKCNSLMIVEDDEDISNALSDLIESEIGLNPVVARNGIEALDKIKTLDKPCLILLDLMMPVMDGFQFLSKIKEESMEGVLHIVVITASSKKDLQGHRVIRKPFNLDQLMETISDICGRGRKGNVSETSAIMN